MLQFFYEGGKMMNYSNDVSKAIKYIQQHISTKLTLLEISEFVGYSSYHFHRLFKHETGLSLYDYIKQQRLIQSAILLKYTNRSILDIALQAQFTSQESFTRAFRKGFNLPPKKYRKLHQIIIKQGEEAMEQTNSNIKGWFLSGNAGYKYQITLDSSITHISQQSAQLYSTTDNFEAEEFGTIMQQFKAKTFLGKRIKFSAFLKTELTAGSSGLWVRVDSKYYDMLAFDNMQDRLITQTSDWNYYSCVLDVPLQADVINIGITLVGSGCVWVNACQFKEVSLNEDVTEIAPSQFVPDLPEHLDFS